MRDEQLLQFETDDAQREYAEWLDSLATEEADRAFETEMLAREGREKEFEPKCSYAC